MVKISGSRCYDSRQLPRRRKKCKLRAAKTRRETHTHKQLANTRPTLISDSFVGLNERANICLYVYVCVCNMHSGAKKSHSQLRVSNVRINIVNHTYCSTFANNIEYSGENSLTYCRQFSILFRLFFSIQYYRAI